MIIQHNIMALNAHRQLGGNNSLVSKNLEKLSSGYKINRAGDDAAGLAISEKMRAQITGLTRAQANAQDGISLVQTAEGALTEVHSMLNRMVDLTTQAANGTIKTDDRQKAQDEIKALSAEIDRISSATDFNGIKLLDGSLGGGKRAANVTGATVNGVTLGAITSNAATKTSYAKGTAVMKAANTGIEVEYTDDTGNKKIATITNVTTGANLADRSKAIVEKLNENSDFAKTFKASVSATGEISFEAVNAGATDATITSVKTSGTDAVTADLVAGISAGTDANMTLTATNAVIAGDSFSVNGKTFEFVTAGGKATQKGAIAVDVGTGGTAAADSLANLNKAMDEAGTGVKATHAGGAWTFSPNADATSKGLTMQVGDSNEAYNKVTVSVGDMSTAGLSISGLSVIDQDVAAASLEKVKTAINTVSENRSALGAMQNRLEHTINNLAVTTENMTAAESRIRDVDMAKEMMQFTKNNVLSQAAQAMLAQANQQPQQVLQLLR